MRMMITDQYQSASQDIGIAGLLATISLSGENKLYDMNHEGLI